MNSGTAKRIRRTLRQEMKTGVIGRAWIGLRACPLRHRIRLACRLVRGRNIDGTKPKPEASK